MTQPVPETSHAAGADGQLVYDARCWWCRQVTAQPRPSVGHLDQTLADAHKEKRP